MIESILTLVFCAGFFLAGYVFAYIRGDQRHEEARWRAWDVAYAIKGEGDEWDGAWAVYEAAFRHDEEAG